jgi:histidine triad (HIT) family protein
MTDRAQRSDCLFCRIAARELAAEIVEESDRAVAFRDVNPQAPTHILIVPKEHIESLAFLGERDGALLADMVQMAAHLAAAEGVDGSGWRVVANTGPDAGQSVQHLHLHVLGGRLMSWPPG